MYCDAGRPRTHPLQQWAGAPGCRSIGKHGAEEGWVLGSVEPPKIRWPWQPCQCLSALPCSWPKSTALPWSPSHSLSWSNSISCHQKRHKKRPQNPFQNIRGLRLVGGSLPPPSAFSQSEQMKHYWKTEFLCRHPVALWSRCILLHDIICTVQFCVTCVGFCLSLPLSSEVYDTSEKAHLQKAAFWGW